LKIHIVQKGDTLWELSKQYGVNFEELKQANPQLSSPDMIMPGMKIKIPSNSKAVKKEMATPKEMPKKEMQKKETSKKETQHPYQNHTPKPMPVIHEDDHHKKMIPKPEMPVQPFQPMPAQPIMEQEFQNYTTINFPQMPHHHESKKEKPKEHVKKEMHHMPMPMPEEHGKPEMQPMPQPQFQPMPCHMPPHEPVHMIPLCCHMMHPCCPQTPFPIMVNPEWIQPDQQMQHGMPYEQMPVNQPPHHAMEMPINPMQMGGNNDCGCRGDIPMEPSGMQFGSSQQDTSQPLSHPLQTTQGNMYPPQFTDNINNQSLYPSPPAYPDFSNTNYQKPDETTGE
jgi:morphogenetic protein associated with SpoVID